VERIKTMLSKKMETALNKQVHAELYSAYLYLAMSSYFESVNLPGFASWMKIQTQEETAHAMKIYDFVHERGGSVKLAAIEAPPAKWRSPLAAFEAALAHEQKVTGLINSLTTLANQQKDHASGIFLQWFVTEQVEEEATADDIVNKLKLLGKSGHGLFMMDKELGSRSYTPPSSGGE
jgi:ferritin